MDIKELQREVADMGTQLLALSERINSLEVTGVSGEKKIQKQDFEKINQLGKAYPIQRPALADESEIVKKDYLRGLMQLVIGCEESVYEGLLYVARIANGINMHISAEEIYVLGADSTADDIANMYEELKAVKYIFLTDALVVAQLYPKKQDVLAEMIADTSGILGMAPEDMKIITTMARAIVTENWDILAVESFVDLLIDKSECIPNLSGVVPLAWLEQQRVLSGAICWCYYEVKANWHLDRGWFAPPIDEIKITCEASYIIDDWTLVKNSSVLLKGRRVRCHNRWDGFAPWDNISANKESIGEIFFETQKSGLVYTTKGITENQDLWRVFYICHPFDCHEEVKNWSLGQNIIVTDELLNKNFEIKLDSKILDDDELSD